MAQFYWERSQIALGPGESPDLDFEQNFPVFENINTYEIDFELKDTIIDKMMEYKPSPSPDPDSLSMKIWSELYFRHPEITSLKNGKSRPPERPATSSVFGIHPQTNAQNCF